MELLTAPDDVTMFGYVLCPVLYANTTKHTDNIRVAKLL